MFILFIIQIKNMVHSLQNPIFFFHSPRLINIGNLLLCDLLGVNISRLSYLSEFIVTYTFNTHPLKHT